MRRPSRDVVLALLASCAAFAQGWQEERARRAARCGAPACVPAPAPSTTAATAARPASVVFVSATPAPAAGDADAGAELLRRFRASGGAALRPAEVAALEARGAAGDATAASLLAALYADPGFAAADPARAFDWMARYAELGDAAAKLDAAYRTLWDAPDDRPEWRAAALGWLEAAAVGGSAEAALELVLLHDAAGDGAPDVVVDAALAERSYALLERHGDAATLRAAALHFQARHDPASTARAIELWSLQGDRGGEFGSNNAAWLLAVCGGSAAEHERAWRLVQREHRDHGESWQSVDTLAAVQARLGMWGEALATQRRALDLLAADAGDAAPYYAPELQRRLEGYAAFELAREPGLCAPLP